MKLSNTVAIAALIGCVILLALLLRSRDELALANAALASTKSANADLNDQVNRLQLKVVDDAVLKRLKADQREAIKLRGEVGNLKKSLSTAESKIANANAQRTSVAPSLAAINPEPSTNPYTRVFGRKLNATVPAGHGLLFGGWPNEAGKQTFAMAVPTRDPDGGETVTIQAKLFELTDEALSKLDTATLVRAASQQATMNPDQLANFSKSLETTPGVSVLTSPTLSVFSGREGRVSISNHMTVPGTSTVLELGPTIEFIPKLGADGSTVELAVDAKLTLPNNLPQTPQ
jgi:hypothetical protein